MNHVCWQPHKITSSISGL